MNSKNNINDLGREHNLQYEDEKISTGVFTQLPEGVEFQAYDPQHPTGQYQAFIKTVLRGASSGLGVSYNTLANDLEGVNYSSLRSGVLEERMQCRIKQKFFIQQVCKPIFKEWLNHAMTTGKLPFPKSKLNKFLEVEWQPRGWSWVDPLKDVQAHKEQLKLGLITRREISATAGRDFEDTLKQLAVEDELASKYNVPISEDDIMTIVEPEEEVIEEEID